MLDTAHARLLTELRLRLRQGRRRDGAALHELIDGILAGYGLLTDREGMDADLDDVQRSYTERAGRLEVLEDSSGALVGSCGVLPLSETQCELRKLYLVRRFRGHGLGRMLLERALAWAQKHGYREMELHTAAALTEAVALYEAYGFVRNGGPVKPSARCELFFRLQLSARVVTTARARAKP